MLTHQQAMRRASVDGAGPRSASTHAATPLLRPVASVSARCPIVEASSSRQGSSSKGEGASMPSGAASGAHAAAELSTKDIVESFFELLNARDISGLLQLLSDDIVHEDLAHEHPASNKRDVARFYLELFASMADNMQFVIEDITEGNSPTVGVTWHLAVEGLELPLGRGLGFYKFNSRRKICFIRQNPEHFVKVANLALSATGMASPLVNVLGPAASPSFWTNMIGAASSAMSAGQPSDGMQHLVDSALSGIFSAGDSSSHQHSSRAHQSSDYHRQATQRTQPSSSSSSSGARAAPAQRPQPPPQAVPQAPQDSASTGPSSAPTPEQQVYIRTMQTPCTAEQLASALLSAAATANALPEAAAAEPVAANLDSRAALANNIVPAPPRRPSGAGPQAAEPAVVAEPVVVAEQASSATNLGLSSASGDEEPRVALAPAKLSGIWSKVPELSQQDEYERALDLWQISGMQKATAKLIEGLEISHEGSRFNVHHLTMIPYFKVTEKYDLTKPCKVMRRDLRSGQATATAKMMPDQQGVVLDVTFGQPFPGKLEEIYYSPEPGILHVTSTIYVKDQSVGTKQVYRLQQNMTKEELIRQSEKRNGKPTDILRKFGAPV